MPLLDSKKELIRGTTTAAAPIIDHVDTIASLHAKNENSVDAHQRIVETVTARIGRPRTIYVLLAIVSVWVIINSAMAATGRGAYDPAPFYWMQGAVGLYAALVSTIVLTTQNRQQKLSEQRSYLELQVNLVAEQKTAKLIQLLEELRRDLPSVRNRADSVADAMAQAVDAEAVLGALKETLETPKKLP